MLYFTNHAVFSPILLYFTSYAVFSPIMLYFTNYANACAGLARMHCMPNPLIMLMPEPWSRRHTQLLLAILGHPTSSGNVKSATQKSSYPCVACS